jgi:hypothetical protein
MLSHISQKNLLSSSLLVLSLFLLSPEGKAMDDNKYENLIKPKKVWEPLPIDWDNSPNRERFPKKAIVKEENGKIILTTDCSGAHLYQCESQSLKDVIPGDTLRFSYDIEGEAQGLTLILRNKTHQRPIPGAFFALQNGLNKKQDLQFIIPEGAKDISVLLYNVAIIPSATLTINELKIEKEEKLSPTQQALKNAKNIRRSEIIDEILKELDPKLIEIMDKNAEKLFPKGISEEAYINIIKAAYLAKDGRDLQNRIDSLDLKEVESLCSTLWLKILDTDALSVAIGTVGRHEQWNPYLISKLGDLIRYEDIKFYNIPNTRLWPFFDLA